VTRPDAEEALLAALVEQGHVDRAEIPTAEPPAQATLDSAQIR
jgi:hypothetical protein